MKQRRRAHVLATLEMLSERMSADVTGTKTVTEMVPDPDAPMIEVTREVDIVEWDCGSVLAPSENNLEGM